MNDNVTPHKAAEYDQEVLKTVPFYRLFHSETIDLVRGYLPQATVWLDTGCGTGYLVEQAIPFFPETHFLLADPAPAMLDLARSRLARFTSPCIQYLEAVHSEELVGAVPETPQVITAIQSHHYGRVEARRQATEACFEALERGGIYVTFENFRPATSQGEKIALERWLGFQRGAGRSPEAVEEHRQRFDKDYFPITVAEQIELLRTAGFSVVEVFWLSRMQAGFYAIK